MFEIGPKAVSSIKGGSFGLGWGGGGGRGRTGDSLHVVENVVSAIFLVESTSTASCTLGNHHRKSIRS